MHHQNLSLYTVNATSGHRVMMTHSRSFWCKRRNRSTPALLLSLLLLFYLFIYLFILLFVPTNTKPVDLKITYNMVCRLRWSALGKKLKLGKVLWKATALPLCSVTDILWYRYVVSNGSLVIVVIRIPRSSMNSADCEHQAPLVSNGDRAKECVAARATYFFVLLTAAFRLLRGLSLKSVVDVTPSTYRELSHPKRAVCHESRDQSRFVGPFSVSPR